MRPNRWPSAHEPGIERSRGAEDLQLVEFVAPKTAQIAAYKHRQWRQAFIEGSDSGSSGGQSAGPVFPMLPWTFREISEMNFIFKVYDVEA